LSDGGDNMSMRTIKEATDLAVGSGIRVYTVGLGVRIDTVMLRDITGRTGGRFFLCSSSRQLVDVYRAIAKLATRDTTECVIRYDGRCTDGGERMVKLTIRDFCGGTDSDSMKCTTPGNSGTFIPLGLTINSVTVSESQHAVVTIGIRDTMTDFFSPPMELIVRFDPSLLGAPVLTGDGSILSPFDGGIVDRHAGVLRIRMKGSHIAASPGLLFTLDFPTADVRDTTCAEVALTRAMFDEGCLMPSLDSARVCILPCLLDPPLSPSGTVNICTGDTIVFHTIPAYARYAWYRDGQLLPDSLWYFRASAAGRYSVVVTDSLGCEASSPVAVLRFLERLSGTIGNPDTLYAKAGTFLNIPILIHPSIRAGRHVSASVSLQWDSTTFEIIDLRSAPKNAWEGDIHTVFSPGALETTLDGTAANDLDHLLTVGFRIADSPHSFIERISLRALVSTECDGVWETLSPHVAVDGLCEPLLKKRPVVSVSNAPNPFMEETVITVVSKGWTMVDITDIFGRPIARLFEGEFGENERTFRFTHTGGVGRVYFVIVRTASFSLLREIVSTR
ncbi:MAG: hypothetical protein QHI48_11495, partial [Bacteroidota bacterium]|nr:hypothetical protein [Bacteroidota bacterium]